MYFVPSVAFCALSGWWMYTPFKLNRLCILALTKNAALKFSSILPQTPSLQCVVIRPANALRVFACTTKNVDLKNRRCLDLSAFNGSRLTS